MNFGKLMVWCNAREDEDRPRVPETEASHNISFAKYIQSKKVWRHSFPSVKNRVDLCVPKCACTLFPMSYQVKVRASLPRPLYRLFSRLGTSSKVQDYLDALSVNFELSGESNFSPITVFEKKTAHCFEGAVFAAAALSFHGHKPLVMDFATAYDDEDHTVALFKRGKYWGAISKTNHAVLKFRDPIYASVRELAMSYAHEYYLWDGRKSLRGYSRPFDLSKYEPQKWITSGESLDWLMEQVSRSHYFPVIPKNFEQHLRRASNVELKALKIIDFADPRKKIKGNRVG